MPESEIRSTPIWRGEVAIEPLSGGLTNRNYRVVDGDRLKELVRRCRGQLYIKYQSRGADVEPAHLAEGR